MKTKKHRCMRKKKGLPVVPHKAAPEVSKGKVHIKPIEFDCDLLTLPIRCRLPDFAHDPLLLMTRAK